VPQRRLLLDDQHVAVGRSHPSMDVDIRWRT